jgi:hypothetical protein
VTLGDDRPDLMLSFCDGAMTEGSAHEVWDKTRSIFHQLSEVDWDKHRQANMQMAGFFDGISEMAKHAEPELPPTTEIQKPFTKEVKAFLQRRTGDASNIYLLLHRRDEGIIEVALPDIEQLRGELCDRMTTAYLALAVVADGKPMTPESIDALKMEVLRSMKEHMPISYIRALGIV